LVVSEPSFWCAVRCAALVLMFCEASDNSNTGVGLCYLLYYLFMSFVWPQGRAVCNCLCGSKYVNYFIFQWWIVWLQVPLQWALPAGQWSTLLDEGHVVPRVGMLLSTLLFLGLRRLICLWAGVMKAIWPGRILLPSAGWYVLALRTNADKSTSSRVLSVGRLRRRDGTKAFGKQVY
jgi:hypothetical protein